MSQVRQEDQEGPALPHVQRKGGAGGDTALLFIANLPRNLKKGSGCTISCPLVPV